MIKKLLKIIAWLLLIILVATLVIQSPYIYRRYYTYPRMKSALEEIEKTWHQPARIDDGLKDFRGVMHNHSYLSHDSEGTPEQMAAAARQADIDFIFMTDHYNGLQDREVITKGVRGEFGGVLFFVGVETNKGLMPFFIDNAVIDLQKPAQEIINDINSAGGLVFIVHPDEPHDWAMQGYAGMEIYNLHADAKKAEMSLWDRLFETLWSMDKYPMQVYYNLFREPTEYLRIWDGLTQSRKIVGIAGNDSHQNNGIRFMVTDDQTVALRDTAKASKKPIYEIKSRPLLWLIKTLSDDFSPGRTLYRLDSDLYWRSFHFVNTHILAAERSERAFYEALRNGHCFVAFDSLCRATGFIYIAESRQGRAVMGDDIAFAPDLVLKAASPVSARLKLIRNGEQVLETDGDYLEYQVKEPGTYRVEAHLLVRDQILPWIYSNPIYVNPISFMRP